MEDEMEQTFPDERLELIFTCCHPALSLEGQVALTLRTLGGMSTDEIARAFLVPAETMKRRLTRAKDKIKAAGIPFSVPADHLLPERLAAVLAVVYLVFNEGYGGRVDLAAEAIRLGRMLVSLMPDEPEVRGLLGLMLLQDSRRDARFANGGLVLLAAQDRTLWNRDQIAEGRALLDQAIVLRGRGPYVLQAAIASVELNRAIAVAEVEGPDAALEIIDGLSLDEYQYLHSTRAELLRRVGRTTEARAAYVRALELATAEPERRFLEQRIEEL